MEKIVKNHKKFEKYMQIDQKNVKNYDKDK